MTLLNFFASFADKHCPFDTQETAIETALGMASGSLNLDKLQMKQEAWIMAVQLSNTQNYAVSVTNLFP